MIGPYEYGPPEPWVEDGQYYPEENIFAAMTEPVGQPEAWPPVDEAAFVLYHTGQMSLNLEGVA